MPRHDQPRTFRVDWVLQALKDPIDLSAWNPEYVLNVVVYKAVDDRIGPVIFLIWHVVPLYLVKFIVRIP